VKVTQQMYERVKDLNPSARNLWRGLEHALKDVPNVVPFTFEGYPDSQVFLHPCGTVMDVVPGSDLEAEVRDGNCDCEGGQPWQRIYVERPA
jgi:hypothetical protein